MKSGLAALAISTGLLCSADAAGAGAMEVSIEGCSMRADETSRLVKLELGSVLSAGTDASHYRVTLQCSGADLRITIVDPLTKKTLSRSVVAPPASEPEPERLVALTVAQLYRASWLELATDAPSPLPPTEKASPPAEEVESARRAALQRARANTGVGGANMGVGDANMGVGAPNMGVGGANMGVGAPNMGVGAPNSGVEGTNAGVGGVKSGLGPGVNATLEGEPGRELGGGVVGGGGRLLTRAGPGAHWPSPVSVEAPWSFGAALGARARPLAAPEVFPSMEASLAWSPPSVPLRLSARGGLEWADVARQTGKLETLLVHADLGVGMEPLVSGRWSVLVEATGGLAYLTISGHAARAPYTARQISGPGFDGSLSLGLSLRLDEVRFDALARFGLLVGTPAGLVAEDADLSLDGPWSGAELRVRWGR